MELSKMLYNQTGSKKFNMVAFKPEAPISKLVDKIETKVQRLYIYINICLRGHATNGTNGSVLRPYARKCNSKLASMKPEILLSQLEDKVDTSFQRGPVLH